MYEIQRETRELENLRGRARMGYGIFAGGLFAAVLMAFLSDVVWAAGIGLLAVCLYVLICRRDVKKYQKHYRNVKIINEMQGFMAGAKIVDRNLFSLEQLKLDRALPGDTGHGILRVGVRGKLDRGIQAELSDVAFPVSVEREGKRPKNVILSGCYMRFQLKKDSGMYAACFRSGHPLEKVLDKHYRSFGLAPRRWENFQVYAKMDGAPDKGLREAWKALDEHTNGEEILVVDHDRIFVMLKGRFLETGEPDYKHPVTMEALRANYLPELSYLKKVLFQCMEEV